MSRASLDLTRVSGSYSGKGREEEGRSKGIFGNVHCSTSS